MVGRVTCVQDDQKGVFIEFPDKCKFKQDQEVNVSGEKKKRTLKQNSLYWCFLSWLIHPFGGDLQSQGHFSSDALHEDIKSWIKATHEHDFEIDGQFSTAELDKQKFTRFFDLVNQELMVEILGVDTSGFWSDYEKYERQAEYDDDFRKFMDEKVAEVPF